MKNKLNKSKRSNRQRNCKFQKTMNKHSLQVQQVLSLNSLVKSSNLILAHL